MQSDKTRSGSMGSRQVFVSQRLVESSTSLSITWLLSSGRHGLSIKRSTSRNVPWTFCFIAWYINSWRWNNCLWNWNWFEQFVIRNIRFEIRSSSRNLCYPSNYHKLKIDKISCCGTMWNFTVYLHICIQKCSYSSNETLLFPSKANISPHKL